VSSTSSICAVRSALSSFLPLNSARSRPKKPSASRDFERPRRRPVTSRAFAGATEVGSGVLLSRRAGGAGRVEGRTAVSALGAGEGSGSASTREAGDFTDSALAGARSALALGDAGSSRGGSAGSPFLKKRKYAPTATASAKRT
jgi:hypothetical protein